MSLFTQNLQESIQTLGEINLLNEIRQWLGPVSPPAPLGMGDDCAVLAPSNPEYKRLVTTDGVIYQKHFDAETNPAIVGAKLIKRNLSDIAAMGGTPEQALIAIIASPQLKIEWLKEFYTGIRTACETYQLNLVGGDVASTTATEFFCAYVTLLGQTPNPLLRGHSQVGDSLWVTGQLGGSILGHHLDFTPRLTEGQWLAKTPQVHSMIDLSDGLAKDLPTLLAPRNQAMINFGLIPISAAAHTLAKNSGSPAIAHALCDGEDYELSFCLGKEYSIESFKKTWHQTFPQTPIHCIGHVVAGNTSPSHIINSQTNEPLPASWGGYEHFHAF